MAAFRCIAAGYWAEAEGPFWPTITHLAKYLYSHFAQEAAAELFARLAKKRELA